MKSEKAMKDEGRSNASGQGEGSPVCPDCDGVSRRRFLRTVGGVVVVGAAGSVVPASRSVAAARPLVDAKPPETVVKQLYESLTAEQRKIMHFPFDHELRRYVANNWNVVDEDVGAIGKLYGPDQQEMIRLILKGIVTEDGYERIQKQMKDDSGGLEKYTCAIFGKPGEDKFEFVLTGRHCTLRVDGNSVENAAFGGPIFYGHAVEFNEKPDHPGNVWWHQARLANQVFESLDGKQREAALLVESPADNASTVVLKGSGSKLPGLSATALSGDQKKLLEKTLKSLLSMFRESDVDEALDCIKRNGGLDAMNVSFYKQEDLGNDGVWDRWRVEGPTFVWNFRGSPHVHVWVNIAEQPEGGGVRRAKV